MEIVRRAGARAALATCVVMLGCSSSEATDTAVSPAPSDAAASTPPPDRGAGGGPQAQTSVDGGASTAMDAATTKPPPTKQACNTDPDKVGLTTRTTKSGTYVAYVPATYDKTKTVPLVVALHGAGDTAPNYLGIVWQQVADAKNIVVIAPEASAPMGPGFTWSGNDSVGIGAAIEDVYACYSVDPNRFILNGFSAGGILAYAFGITNAAHFSGLAIASADFGSAEAYAGHALLPAAWKIPVSNFQGTQDQNFPIAIVEARKQALVDAGHPFFWHPFDGGHTTNAAMALQMFEDLAPFTAP